MKAKHILTSVTLGLTALLHAGDEIQNVTTENYTSAATPDSPFERAIRPITNPTLFDLAVPRTQIHAIYMHQKHPAAVNIIGGGSVNVGGDFNLFAIQAEYAFNERLSVVATKDGYIDFNPDQNLSHQEGFANVAAGLKYALIYKPEDHFILSGIATVELPLGDSEVWQGEGDGALNLILTDLKMYDRLQLAGSVGVHIPFNSDESLTGFASMHASYEVTPWFIPLVELNWYRVIREGNGTFTFDGQGGSLVPGAAVFEGGDLINLGATNANQNKDAVTLGVGFRSRLTENITSGVAYEFPLTDDQDGLMDSRLTIDMIFEF